MGAVKLFTPDSGRPGLLVRDVVTAYMRHAKAEKLHTPIASKHRERCLNAFLAFEVQGTPIGDQSASECKPWMLTDFILSHEGWKSASSRRGAANSIKACFEWAAKEERIDRNPFRSVRYGESERRPEMADSDLGTFEAVSNKAFERALRFLRLTGCRIGELCQAQWADVDLERGVWTIHRHKSRRYTGRPKVVALVGEAVDLLKLIAATAAVPAVAGLEAVAVSAVPAVDARRVGCIFLNNRGTPWTDATLGQQLRRLKARHGIKTAASLHGVRHRVLSAMIEAGASLKVVAEQAGHSSTAICERYYYHRSDVMTDAMRKALEASVPKK